MCYPLFLQLNNHLSGRGSDMPCDVLRRRIGIGIGQKQLPCLGRQASSAFSNLVSAQTLQTFSSCSRNVSHCLGQRQHPWSSGRCVPGLPMNGIWC